MSERKHDSCSPESASTLPELIRRRYAQHPERRVYTFLPDGETEGARWTWRDLARHVQAVSALLRERTTPGDRALLLCPQTLDYAAAFLGCLDAGVAAVPAYPPRGKRRDERLRALIGDSQPSLVLTTKALRGRVLTALGEDLAPMLAVVDPVNDVHQWGPLLAEVDGTAFVQYTSGSTSVPKGVVVSHGNLMANEETIKQAFGHDENSIVAGWLPFFHDMGLIGNLLQPLYLGARCILTPPAAFIQKPSRWPAMISRYRATTSGGPNFAYDLCVRKTTPEERRDLDLSCWTAAFNGAEPVRAATLRAFSEAFAEAGFREEAWLPCYGLAESTLMVSGRRRNRGGPLVSAVRADRLEQRRFELAQANDERARELVGCGLPARGQEVRIVSESGKPCLDGEIGEIWISGGAVAQGYWGDEQRSRETFQAVAADDLERRYLRSGDLGCLVDGELFVTGRIKDLLIVQGRNFYPQDVELAAAACDPQLTPDRCAAFVWSPAPGSSDSFALVVETAEVSAEVGRALALRVRDAVVREFGAEPSLVAVTARGSIPKTSSGKTRRRACGARLASGKLKLIADWRSRESAQAGRDSDSPTSRTLLELLRRHFGDGKAINPGDSLPSLGLTSLQAAELAFEIERQLGLRVPPEVLLDETPIEELFPRLLSGGASPSVVAAPTWDRPLRPNELAVYTAEQVPPDGDAYHLAARLEVRGPRAAERIEEAFQAVAQRIPALKVGLCKQGDDIRFEELGDDFVPALSTAKAEGAESDEAFARRPFAFGHEPLWRARLASGSEDHAELVFVFHHLIADIWSLGLFWRELVAALNGGSPRLLAGVEPAPAGDEAAQRDQRGKPEGLPGILSLPADGPRPRSRSLRAGRYVRRLTISSDDLRHAASTIGVTPAVLHLTAFQTLLARWTGSGAFAFGVPTSGRRSLESAEAFGYLVEPIEFTADVGDQATFAQLAERTRAKLLKANAPGGPQAERAKDSDVMFVHQESLTSAAVEALALGFPGVSTPCGDLELTVEPLPSETVQRELTWTTGEVDGAPALRIDYDADRFSTDAIERPARWYERLLDAMAKAPDDAALSAPMLDAEERELAIGLPSVAPAPAAGLLHERFEAHAERAPGRVALRWGDETWSYGELNRRANRLARRLRRAGARPEELVAVALDRGVDQLVAVLAVLKSGAAYLPLDMTHPRARREAVLNEAGPALTVTTPEYAGADSDASVVFLEDDGEESSDDLSPTALPDNLAYVIFTSGSTGLPKGCAVTHQNVLRLFASIEPVGDRFGPDDVWSVFHSTAFDFSVWEIWGSWLHGGTAVLADEAVRRDPKLFADLLEREAVTRLSVTPTAFRNLVGTMDGSEKVHWPSLKQVYFGGENFDLSLLRDWLDRNPQSRARLVNLFGITETTVHVTYRPLAADDVARERSPIGSALPDLGLYALTSGLEPSAVGAPGELYVSGAGLARGYLGKPGLTAARFLPDPYSPNPGARMYRSGDLARLSADGEREYLGRSDEQVQIRGYRVEPAEIQRALEALPQIATALVRARPRPVRRRFVGEPESASVRILPHRRYVKGSLGEERTSDDSRLVAWVVPASGAEPLSADLRRALRDRLPDAMIPEIAVVDALPLTANGKVDADALPDPMVIRESSAREFAPPRTETEKALASIWSDVLQVANPGVEDDFFALGGDSIRAIQVVARAEEKGLRLTVADLMQAGTVRALARLCEPDEGTVPEASGPALEPFALVSDSDRDRLPQGVVDAAPLTRMQLGLLYHESRRESSPVYRASFLYRFQGDCRSELFQEALERVVERTPILRTGFDLTRFGRPLQLVWDRATPVLDAYDWAALDEAEREAAWDEWFDREREHAFDLARPPLARFSLFRLGDGEFAFGLTCHDAILDGWSTALLLTDLLTSYAAKLGARSEGAAGRRDGFFEHVALERAALTSEESRRYWRELLKEAPEPAIRWLPPDDAPAERSLRVVDAPVPEGLSDVLKDVARSAGVSFKHLLLAVHMHVLSALAAEDDVVSGLEVNGRAESATGFSSVGQHLNTVPFRMSLVDGSWLDLIRAVGAAERALWPHRRFPYAEIQKDAGGRPLYDATFNFTQFHVFEELQRLPELRLLGGKGRELTHYDLKTECNVDVFSGRLHLDLIFDGSRMSEQQARDIGAMYLRAMHAAAEEPTSRRRRTNPLGDEESTRLLRFSRGPSADLAATTLTEMFELACERSPDGVAMIFGDRTMTYRGLRERARRIAAALQRHGVGAESVVGVHLDRSEALPATLLGVLYAGAAYLPLDPSYPSERLRRSAEDAGARWLVTEQNRLGRFEQLEELSYASLDRQPTSSEQVRPDQAAYVLFTSGSTGRPKGAVVTHEAIANRLAWMQAEYELEPGERVLHKTPISFDVSGWELFWPLIAGGTLVVAPPGAQGDAVRLAEIIERHAITTLHFVPSMLGAFLEEPSVSRCRSLRRTICSGEELSPDLARRFFARLPGELHNLYGPTEAAIDVTSHACRTEEGGSRAIPIGRAVWNTQTLILDSELMPVPTGAAGRLFLGGVQLARGYAGRPSLTAERFLPSPWPETPGERIYDTGDLARWAPNGEIEFVGRQDGQVKIRGVRVELGEIEAAIRACDGVVAAVATLAAGSGGRERLVAYVEARTSASLDFDRLREQLQARLPAPMIPERFIAVDAMPLTPSGKLDRRALTSQPSQDAELDGLLEEIDGLKGDDLEELLATLSGSALAASQSHE